MRLIGFEKEYFLLDSKNNMIFPPEDQFPLDDFKFLVELRSDPGENFDDAYASLIREETRYSELANSLGLSLIPIPYMIIDKHIIENHMSKNNFYSIPPKTFNVYKHTRTMHYGVFNISETKSVLTAGLHIHYSDDKQFPNLADIAKHNDMIIGDHADSYRILGECEYKEYPNGQKGGEYRSCKNNTSQETLRKLIDPFLRGEIG